MNKEITVVDPIEMLIILGPAWIFNLHITPDHSAGIAKKNVREILFQIYFVVPM